MKTLTKTTTIELFDYAKSIGCFISFTGSYAPDNTFANVDMRKPCFGTATIDGWGVYGRSEEADVEEALVNFAKKISRKTISFDYGPDGRPTCSVPKLKHTKGYRG